MLVARSDSNFLQALKNYTSKFLTNTSLSKKDYSLVIQEVTISIELQWAMALRLTSRTKSNCLRYQERNIMRMKLIHWATRAKSWTQVLSTVFITNMTSGKRRATRVWSNTFTCVTPKDQVHILSKNSFICLHRKRPHSSPYQKVIEDSLLSKSPRYLGLVITRTKYKLLRLEWRMGHSRCQGPLAMSLSQSTVHNILVSSEKDFSDFWFLRKTNHLLNKLQDEIK